jgi:hypothetical protein
MTAFARYIGIDYSGAQTPTANLKGLRVYVAAGDASPVEVPPPQPSRTQSTRKYWSRKAIAEWLVERLAEDVPTLVGIDHGFSFPLRYFEVHHLQPDWPAFLDDFQRHWPTNEDHTYVDFIRDGVRGKGAERTGDARWRRLTELRTGRAKSVFYFDVQGSVAKSTLAGIPWLRLIRQRLGQHVHFWPVGTFRLGTLPSSRFIRHYGAESSTAPTGRATNTMPTACSKARKGHEAIFRAISDLEFP